MQKYFLLLVSVLLQTVLGSPLFPIIPSQITDLEEISVDFIIAYENNWEILAEIICLKYPQSTNSINHLLVSEIPDSFIISLVVECINQDNEELFDLLYERCHCILKGSDSKVSNPKHFDQLIQIISLSGNYKYAEKLNLPNFDVTLNTWEILDDSSETDAFLNYLQANLNFANSFEIDILQVA